MCKALFPWVNAGSHYGHDDLYIAVDGAGVEAYLEVFHKIFVQSGQEGHYRMMMGDAYKELTEEKTTSRNPSTDKSAHDNGSRLAMVSKSDHAGHGPRER